MSQGINGLIELLIVPPGLSLWLLGLGLWFYTRKQILARWLIGAALGTLLLASLPLVAGFLMGLLENYPPLDGASLNQPQAQAIVILAGGRRKFAPEFGTETVSALTLERARYGAWLAKKTGLPVLVTGGLGENGSPGEARLMQKVLEEEFSQPVAWVEDASRNTYENATLSQAILKEHQIESVYVVTHACHLPRAMWSFRQAGLKPIAAPTAFANAPGIEASDFLPNASSVFVTAYAVHEILGNIWYRLRY